MDGQMALTGYNQWAAADNATNALKEQILISGKYTSFGEIIVRIMNVFENSKWIWVNGLEGKNVHAEFYGKFVWKDGDGICRLSCDSDYVLYINGVVAASNQYGDYEHFKSYDTIDITPYLKEGDNSFAVHVWYWGEPSQRYYTAKAGVIFEVLSGERTLLVSNERIISRKSRGYISGLEKKITYQLGYSFCYDANLDDEWTVGKGTGFLPSICVDKHCNFVARPNEKLVLTGKTQSSIIEISNDKRHYVVDLLKESVGLPCLSFCSNTKNNHIIISYGEVLEDGHVKRFIGPRDFSFEYVAKVGQNEFTHYCLRLGCRYLEFYSDEPIDLEYAGLILQEYPLKVGQVYIEDDFDRKMYDMSVRTLQLCMMEHYVDCPWREQCFYALDSRNQILFGYYAFVGGNYRYVRSNLELYGKSLLLGGLFPICAPCEIDLCIPSFALHYFTELKEYTQYSGDTSLAKELYPTLCKVLDNFLKNRKDGLMCVFEDEIYWNFYDWSPYMDYTTGVKDEMLPDFMINGLTVMALRAMEYLCEKIGKVYPYQGVKEEIIDNTRKTFFVEEDGLFSMKPNEHIYTELANSVAILNGFATEIEAQHICKKMVEGKMYASSMSTRGFKYDALLQTNEEGYREYVLNDLRKDFKVMIDAGATSTWETMDGAAAFNNAGSLCHAWTALPVYYFHKLGIAKYKN